MLDVNIWNSYVLYKCKSGKELSFAKFHLLLITEIFGKYLLTPGAYQGNRNTDSPLRLIERHFPSKYFNPSSKKKILLENVQYALNTKFVEKLGMNAENVM